MIIVKTPLRISFMGGGSDISRFYRKSAGATLSTAIDKYVYICVNKKFDDHIRVSYSETEIVKNLRELKHTRAKACLKHMGITNGIEIVTIADIPSRGTGLGSSSSFTVGLLRALYAYKGQVISEEQLAAEACRIEIDILKEPIGKQDQYIASYGNLRFIRYLPQGKVQIDYVVCRPDTLKQIEDSLLLFYTGLTRATGDLLKNQIKNYSDKQKFRNTQMLVEMAYEMKKNLEANNTEEFGNMLHQAWLLKKSLNDGITSKEIDRMYETARRNGALGGKILGAGGGGFLMVYAPRERHEKIKQALKKYKPMRAKFDHEGSKTLFINKNFANNHGHK